MIRKEYEIIEALSKEFSIVSLCELMKVSRSGYYKWHKRKGTHNRYQLNRKHIKQILRKLNAESKTAGYRVLKE